MNIIRLLKYLYQLIGTDEYFYKYMIGIKYYHYQLCSLTPHFKIYFHSYCHANHLVDLKSRYKTRTITLNHFKHFS